MRAHITLALVAVVIACFVLLSCHVHARDVKRKAKKESATPSPPQDPPSPPPPTPSARDVELFACLTDESNVSLRALDLSEVRTLTDMTGVLMSVDKEVATVLSTVGHSNTHEAVVAYLRDHPALVTPAECATVRNVHTALVSAVRDFVAQARSAERERLVAALPEGSIPPSPPDSELFLGDDWMRSSMFPQLFFSYVPFNTTLRMLEIGSHEGRSALFMMRNSLPEATLDCIDYFGPVERFHNALKPYMEQKRVRHIHDKSFPALTRLLAAENPRTELYDFVYVDACHTATRTMEDIVLAYHLLRVGGVLAIDDYLWMYGRRPTHHTPKPAVDGFLATYAGELEVLHVGTQVWVRKLQLEDDFKLCWTDDYAMKEEARNSNETK